MSTSNFLVAGGVKGGDGSPGHGTIGRAIGGAIGGAIRGGVVLVGP